MRLTLLSWFFGLLILMAPALNAHAWDLSVVGGMNYSHPSLNPDPPTGTKLSTKGAVDFGALATFSIGENYYFETGAIRHSRATIATDSTSATETRYSGWLIPLTFRFMRAEFFGFGFGPYVALLNARTKSVTTYTGGSRVEINANDPNRKDHEVGLRANLHFQFPVYHEAKAVIDGSYLFGFTDINKSGVNEDKSQELLVLIGFQIPIGGAVDEPAPPPTKNQSSDRLRKKENANE